MVRGAAADVSDPPFDHARLRLSATAAALSKAHRKPLKQHGVKTVSGTTTAELATSELEDNEEDGTCYKPQRPNLSVCTTLKVQYSD